MAKRDLDILNPYPAEVERWLKGNTHCHSTKSDGSQSPEEVCRLYESYDYDFIVLTDHDVSYEVFSGIVAIEHRELGVIVRQPGRVGFLGQELDTTPQ